MTVLFLFFCDEICNFFGGVGILYGIKIMFLNFGASYILVVVLVVFLVFPRPSKAAFGSCISFDKKKKIVPCGGGCFLLVSRLKFCVQDFVFSLLEVFEVLRKSHVSTDCLFIAFHLVFLC